MTEAAQGCNGNDDARRTTNKRQSRQQGTQQSHAELRLPGRGESEAGAWGRCVRGQRWRGWTRLGEWAVLVWPSVVLGDPGGREAKKRRKWNEQEERTKDAGSCRCEPAQTQLLLPRCGLGFARMPQRQPKSCHKAVWAPRQTRALAVQSRSAARPTAGDCRQPMHPCQGTIELLVTWF